MGSVSPNGMEVRRRATATVTRRVVTTTGRRGGYCTVMGGIMRGKRPKGTGSPPKGHLMSEVVMVEAKGDTEEVGTEVGCRTG